MNYFEAIAVKDHKAIHPSQLTFKKGETILVFETAATGWWRGELFGKKGLFPQSFVIYNKELYGENPLANAANNTSILVTPTANTNLSSSANINPSTILNPNASANPRYNSVPSSPYSAAAKSSATVDYDFDEIDRIIQSTSPHTSSPPPAQKKPAAAPPKPIYNTISPNSPMLSAKPDPSIKLSPRFNITKEQITESLGSLESPKLNSSSSSSHSNSSANSSGTLGVDRHHTRKTSSPPGLITESSAPDESYRGSSNGHANTSANGRAPAANPHATAAATGNSSNGALSSISESDGDSANRFKTLPNSSAASKARKPISNILSSRATGRISINDVNTDTPFYITRAVLPYTKQAYDELSINTDDLIVVYNSRDIEGDWWVGKLKNLFGIFPKTCVEIMTELQRSSRDSTPTQSSPTLQSQQKPPQQQQQQINKPPTPAQTTPNISRSNSNSSNTPAQPTQTPEEQAIAAKIEASFSYFATKEEMLEAVKGLAIKFVRQTTILKQELEQEKLKYEQEKTLRAAFERELMSIKNQR